MSLPAKDGNTEKNFGKANVPEELIFYKDHFKFYLRYTSVPAPCNPVNNQIA